MKVVVSYDISEDRNRRKVAKLLEAILTRVQYSVFEGEVPGDQLSRQIDRALRYLEPETDSIRVYPLCASCIARMDVHGRSVPVYGGPFRIV